MNNSLTLTVSKSEKGKHKKENQKTNQETTTKSTEKTLLMVWPTAQDLCDMVF
jgi:hypothetical protein